ncbi:hypothetical protein D3C78_1015710 [compost metagenome]
MGAGQLHGIDHVLGAFGKHHGAGRGRLQRAFVAAMLLAHGQGLRALGAKSGDQGVKKGCRHRAWLDGGQQVLGSGGCIHWESSRIGPKEYHPCP